MTEEGPTIEEVDSSTQTKEVEEDITMKLVTNNVKCGKFGHIALNYYHIFDSQYQDDYVSQNKK